MREIRLHDTRSGELQPLRPRDPGKVGVYACGPTVYSRIHIGNARPFVIFSLLARLLAHEGYETTLVINVTDVNDKIYDAARAQDRSSGALASEMTALYFADTDALALGRPDHEPLASQTMGPIVDYIAALIEAGHAYESGGDVFFRVRSDPDYGSLSHRGIEDMDQGEGVEGSDRKDDPLDFALWKARKPDEDSSWDSPWGPGRPGWHIECSAMAEQALGVGFEIHGGGSDLLFPHHENEAAQTRAARGAELARIWMHNGMIQSTGEKMAKSVGNIAPLHEVIERYGRDAVLMFLVTGHYRQPLAFSPSELEDADRRVHRIRDALRRLDAGAPSPADMAGRKEAFFESLAEDFNTPKALASLFEWVREANRRSAESAEGTAAIGDGDLREMLDVLGLGGLTALEAVGDLAVIDPEALALLARREQARAERDFAVADELREQLRARGWEIRDGPAGGELIPIAEQ
ncbi:MAG TPA: cysteine--tRNA ligase [Solirubrobacteraceae bacterium]|jgi:cysteinyl-tRNA synthetase